ncbi:MAG: hypothetical protein IJ155_01090 [Prevotella sp.]|nr:hypothetical protein [Prevotella sp.]
MKNDKLTMSAICLLLGILLLQPMCVHAQEALSHRTGETDDFRRSSLCLMLITNRGDKYAQAIEQQFLAMPLPNRYNGLNVSVRCINVSSRQSDANVASMLRSRGVAKELVGMWFNRDYNGYMNMDRIHQWGGYSASYADLQRAQHMERGLALLSDEGSELIKNTFVLVCDISYFDRAKTGQWLSILGQGLAAFSNSMAQQYEQRGRDASAYRQLGQSFQLGAKAAEDIAGFSVNVMARLYRLKWDDNMRDYFYTQYWIDQTTPADEATRKKAAFDRDRNSFQLEYLGNFRARAGRTVSKSNNDLDLVIRDVCANAVDQSINNLSKRYPVFRAKSQFRCEGSNIYAYIGTKEGLTRKSKFEVLETKKTKNGFEYHKVAELKPRTVWNNQGLNISDAAANNAKGSAFYRSSGRSNICDQGLLIREMGKLGYQYKRNRWYFEPFVGQSLLTAQDVAKKDDKSSGPSNGDDFEGMTTFGLNTGWIINYHTNIAWNVFNIGFAYGSKDESSMIVPSLSTGVILRTNPLGKKGRYALYLWPTVGGRFVSTSYEGIKSTSHYRSGRFGGRYNTYSNESLDSSWFDLDWNIKAGITLGEKFSIGASYNDLYWSGMVTIYL